MKKHITTLTLEVELEIEYGYFPEEKESLEGPGCDEEVELLSVNVMFAGGKYSEDLMAHIKEMVFDDINRERIERRMELAESRLGGVR